MQINPHYQLIMQVPDNVADTLHSSLLDTQVETDKRRLVQEVSTKYRIVNRERETKQVITTYASNFIRNNTLSNDPHRNVRTHDHCSWQKFLVPNTEPDLSAGIMINVIFSKIVCGDLWPFPSRHIANINWNLNHSLLSHLSNSALFQKYKLSF